MILIGQDEKLSADNVKKWFESAGVPTAKIKTLNYLKPGGGGEWYTEAQMAREFENSSGCAGERTAFIIDLSPQRRVEDINWGLTVLAKFAERLHQSYPSPENLYKLLGYDDFLFVLYSKYVLTPNLLSQLLHVDLSRIEFWSSFNLNQWENSDVPKQRQKPFLMYVREKTDGVDEARIFPKVVTWLTG